MKRYSKISGTSTSTSNLYSSTITSTKYYIHVRVRAICTCTYKPDKQRDRQTNEQNAKKMLKEKVKSFIYLLQSKCYIVTIAIKCTFSAKGMGQTDRRTDGRIAALLNALLWAGHRIV